MSDQHPACADLDPAYADYLFFGQREGQMPTSARRQIDRLCGSCGFRDPCLQEALTYNVEGIWAGTTLAQRQEYRRRRGVKPVPLHATYEYCNPDAVAALVSQGYTTAEIAAELRVTVRQVNRTKDKHGLWRSKERHAG